jgi:hypothetical protein
MPTMRQNKGPRNELINLRSAWVKNLLKNVAPFFVFISCFLIPQGTQFGKGLRNHLYHLCSQTLIVEIKKQYVYFKNKGIIIIIVITITIIQMTYIYTVYTSKTLPFIVFCWKNPSAKVLNFAEVSLTHGIRHVLRKLRLPSSLETARDPMILEGFPLPCGFV